MEKSHQLMFDECQCTPFVTQENPTRHPVCSLINKFCHRSLMGKHAVVAIRKGRYDADCPQECNRFYYSATVISKG